MYYKMMRPLIGFLRRLYRTLPARPLRGILAPLYYRYLTLRHQNKLVATVDGITYEFDLRELIDSTIYYEGAWEPDTVAALRRLIKPGHIDLDIGANMGCHALLMAQLAGETGRVIAFEPMSVAYARLQRNIGLNHFPTSLRNKSVCQTAPARSKSHLLPVSVLIGNRAMPASRRCPL